MGTYNEFLKLLEKRKQVISLTLLAPPFSFGMTLQAVTRSFQLLLFSNSAIND